MPTDSRRLMNRSYRRIKRLGNRPEGEELYTADPALLEVEIAQVDATLAVAAAIGEATIELSILRRQVAHSGGKPGVHFEQTTEQQQLDFLNRRVNNVANAVRDLIAQMDKLHPAEGTDPASVRPNPASPWWAIWEAFRRKE